MRAMSTLRRIAPALALLVLSPLVAEFLLGDFSIRQFGLIVVLLPQYGGGALLVRETARRASKGWPSMILLALAYALIEEGFTTQSLFNPNYAGQRLLLVQCRQSGCRALCHSDSVVASFCFMDEGRRKGCTRP